MSKLDLVNGKSGLIVRHKKFKPAGVTIFLLLALMHLLILLRGIHQNNMMRQFDEAYFSEEDVSEAKVFNRNTSNVFENNVKPVIPKRLIFTYKYNLINPSKDDPPFDANDPLTANVLNTIDKYTQYWNNSDKLLDEDVPNNANDEVIVSFLSNADCVKVINKAEPKLVEYFTNEKRGDLKADICRIAELLFYGGYYFDADINVVEPVNFEALPIQDAEISYPSTQLGYLEQGSGTIMPSAQDIVTFATVINVQGVFFQAFLAAMPNHPTIKRALDYILAYYEGNLADLIPDELLPKLARYSDTIPSRKHTHRIGLGCYTLAAAYLISQDDEWVGLANQILKDSGRESIDTHSNSKTKMNFSRFLYEISLTSNNVTERGLFRDVPLQVYKKNRYGDRDWCNFICFGGNKVYFYSRVIGSRGCPKK